MGDSDDHQQVYTECTMMEMVLMLFSMESIEDRKRKQLAKENKAKWTMRISINLC